MDNSEPFSPHDTHHYENDERQAAITFLLLAIFCVAVALLAVAWAGPF